MISEMTLGQLGRVVGYKPGDLAHRQRLLAMGLTIGTEFILSRVAPLGDPVVLTVKGYDLCLRKDEAHNLLIEKVNP